MSHSSLEEKKYLSELICNQLKNIQPNRRLVYKDLCRLSKYLTSSIFDTHECCIWNGYITNSTNFKKGTYINFFFRNKKVALHRLLYDNFIGVLDDDHYLKFTCDDAHRGRCCNINHMIKCAYNTIDEQNSNDNNTNRYNKLVKNKIVINFD